MKYGELAEIKLDGQEPLKGILIKIRNPPKTAVLRLPTAQETLARMGSIRQLRITAGNREPRIEWPADPNADAAFFKALRLDSGADFDDAEIKQALSALTFTQLSDCEMLDNGFRIVLNSLVGTNSQGRPASVDTVHLLGDPTLADLSECRRKSVSTRSVGTGRQETRYPPQPAIELYDRIVQRWENYADTFTKETIPPDHKYAAIQAMIKALDEIDAPIDPNA